MCKTQTPSHTFRQQKKFKNELLLHNRHSKCRADSRCRGSRQHAPATKSREVDVFASSYFTTRPFAHGYERDSHEEPIYPSKKNASIKGKFEISRAFDLVHQLYVVIDLPGIANAKGTADHPHVVTPADEDDMPYFTNGVGAALINEVHISMGGHSIACLTGVLIFLYEELAGTPGKRADALLGKASTVRELKMQSTRARRLYVPMYFFFCSTRGSLSNALNIIGAQFQRVHLDMVLNSLASVIENGAPNLKSISDAANGVFKTVIIDPISLEPMLAPVRQTGGDVTFSADGEELRTAANCARVTVDTHGITLAEEDRATFSSVQNMVLMDEVHILNRVGSNALTNNDEIDITQFAKNLVFEILVAARVTTDGERRLVLFARRCV